MCPIAPDIGNVATTIHQHGVPREQGPVIKRRGTVAIYIGHEFGGTGLGRAGAAVIGSKAQLPGQRRLDARPVENFTLDGGTIDNLLGDKFDGQAIALIGVKMVGCTNDDARAFQELRF